MITRMRRISPSDMALSRKGGRRGRIRAVLRPPTKHILRPRSMEALTLPWFQLQGRRIDAVAKAGRPRAVVEDMAEVAGAVRAKHFGADHAVARVRLLVDMVFVGRLGEARPAAAGVELGVGFEQGLAAAGADIAARTMLMLILAGEGALGRLLP